MTTGGTGLGLYIARQLANAMGGEIAAATSALGEGSPSFTLSDCPRDVRRRRRNAARRARPGAPRHVRAPAPRRAERSLGRRDD